MQISVEHLDNGECLVRIDGEINTVNAEELWSELEDLVDEEEVLILDFEKVSFISSAGFRILLKAEKEIRSSGELRIRNVSDSVYETFKLVNFDKLVTIEGRDEKNLSLPQEVLQLEFETITATDKKDQVPAWKWYIFKNPSIMCFQVLDQGVYAGFAICTNMVGIAQIEYLYIEEGFRRRGIATKFVGWLIDKFCYLDCFELTTVLMGEGGLGLYQKLVKEYGFSQINEQVVANYSMKDVLQNDLSGFTTKMSSFFSYVKTVNEIPEVMLVQALSEFSVAREDIDPVFTRFFVKDDQVLGIINATECSPGMVVMYQLVATGNSDAKIAVITLILSLIQVASSLLDESATLYFVCKNMSQIKAFEKILGSSQSIEKMIDCMKILM